MRQLITMKNVLRMLPFCVVMLSGGLVSAQTPSDAFMEKQGQICVGLYYNNSSWSEYWEGDSLRTNGNIGTVSMTTITGGIQLGILDRLNLFVMAPYVITKSTPEPHPISGLTTTTMVGEQGFQDIALFLKGSILDKHVGKGNLDILATLGYTTPMSNYTPDATFPLGLGCSDGIFRGIVQYTADFGVYARVDGAFHLRGNSELVRNYYYSTGSYYTSEIDMPDAIDYNITLGYITPSQKFKADVALSTFNTLDGFDIRPQDIMFPSNEMDMMRLNFNAEYFNLFVDGLAINGYAGITLDGRNAGKAFNAGGGILYIFNLWTPGQAEKAAE